MSINSFGILTASFAAILFLGLQAVPSAAVAGDAVGTSAGLFTAIEPDPRGASLGGAGVGLSADASAVYWNPAALSGVKGFSLVLSHMNWLGLFNYEFASASRDLGPAGSFGISVSYLRNDSFKESSISGGTSGLAVRFENVIASAAYSRKLFGLVAPGVSFKVIQQNYYQNYSLSWLADAGVFAGPFKGLTFGASALNLGPAVKFKNATDPMNFVVRAGGAYQKEFAGAFSGLTAAFAVDYDRSAGLVLRGGVEPLFSFNAGKLTLSPRAGVRYEQDLLNVTAGLGIGVSGKFRFDYGIKTFIGLPMVHQFGVVIGGSAENIDGGSL